METKQTNTKLMLRIGLISVIFFFFIGQRGYIEMRDTSSYCLPNLIEGIMPIYPLLINICRIVFGHNYLHAVATIQGALAVVIVTYFVMFLREKFNLQNWECYLVWIASVLPFAIELPRYILTHVIYTEGITYSLFYLFVICVLNTLFERKWKKSFWLAVSMAIVMGLIRPQLMLLLILCSILFIYKVFVERRRGVLPNLIIGVIVSLLLTFIGVISIYKIREIYINNMGKWFERKYHMESVVGEQVGEMDEEQDVPDSFGQLGSALICRTFYEAESDDYLYYTDPDMQKIFVLIYEECDKRQILYPYAKEGLWMWEDLTQTDIYRVASNTIEKYLREKYQEIEVGTLSRQIAQIKIKIAIKESQLHFGRFLYHCFRLMIPGFISCVFFNVEEIYLLCHIITAFLYISAVGMALFILKKKRDESTAAVFMLASVVSCVVFVGIVNSIFFGMQRYFIYNMGVFYCAYYLTLRTIFYPYLKNAQLVDLLLHKYQYKNKL